MWLDASHPANALVLEAQRRRRPGAVPIASPDSVENPYWNCGSHPDIVEALWNGFGGVLPPDARCLLYGGPALVLPISGVVVAVAFGTQFCIRVPAWAIPELLAAGAETVHRWGPNPLTGERHPDTDIQREFGPDWIFAWSAPEHESICFELVALEFESAASGKPESGEKLSGTA